MTAQTSIAVIGISERFPGADNVTTFWKNLINEVESIVSLDHGYQHLNSKHHSQYIPAKGYLERADYFAADFFKLTPRNAEIMDPQFRLFLECVWEAWEDAGYNPNQFNGSVGVYATSSSQNTYYEKNLSKNEKIFEDVNEYELLIHNARDFLATLIAYKFNFKGPAINIQTACSSSLVAICHACDDLISKKCDIAVVGGMSVTFPLEGGYFFREGMIYSKDGHCRPFAVNATGVVPGNGGAVVLLKLMDEAIKDKDHIYAVIRGYAVNNDGANKLSFAAPSVDAQIAVLKAAATNANIDPGDVQFIEAHGTGTPLGDQVEVTALREYLSSGKTKPFCKIGSVKSNIGHLDVAAGIASFIKTVLVLKHKVIPKSLHAEHPNPNLDLNDSLSVAQNTIAWNSHSLRRYAGVSSFGVGGTNAHIILEEAPICDPPSDSNDKSWQILPLAARTPDELEQLKDKMAEYLHTCQHKMKNIAYTLQVGREAFKHRLCVISNTPSLARDALYYPSRKKCIIGESRFVLTKTIFVFNDDYEESSQIPSDNYLSQLPLFQSIFLQCLDTIQKIARHNDIKQSLRIVAFQYSLAKTYIALGIIPQMILGYGIGEYVAASVADLFDFSEAIKLVTKHWEFLLNDSNVIYLEVLTSEKELEVLIEKTSSVVNIISIDTQNRCIVAGSHEAIQSFQLQLKSLNIFSKINHKVSIILPELSDQCFKLWSNLVRGIKLRKEAAKILLNGYDITNHEYWTKKIKNVNNFYQHITSCLETNPLFLEIGISKKCTSLIKQIVNHKCVNKNIFTISYAEESEYQANNEILLTLAKLWVEGIPINWVLLHDTYQIKRVSLPTYPFSRQRYLIEPSIQHSSDIQPSLNFSYNYADIKSWLHVPQWREYPLENEIVEQNFDVIFLIKDRFGILDQLITELSDEKNNKFKVIQITPASANGGDVTNVWLHNRMQLWEKEFSTLNSNSRILILHAAGLTSLANLEALMMDSFYDFVALAKVIGNQKYSFDIKLVIVVNNNQPLATLALGPTLCLPLEYPIDTKYLELDLNAEFSQLIQQLKVECFIISQQRWIKLNGHQRFLRQYINLEESNQSTSRILLKKKGVYLITGGLGGIGLTLAAYLAEFYQANLVLISRTKLPDKDQWNLYMEDDSVSPSLKKKLKQLLAINRTASSLRIFSADVADTETINNIVNQIGNVNGVIHAAAVVPEGLLQNKSIEKIQLMFRAKIYGLQTLLKVFADQNLDFLLLCSALNTILGEAGAVDYVSANAYMDAVAIQNNTFVANFPVISIAWDAWCETGMRFEYLSHRNAAATYDPQSCFIKIFDKSLWKIFVEEHYIDNDKVIPGSLLLTFFCDAMKLISKFALPMVINNFYFMQKGVVKYDEEIRFVKIGDDLTKLQIELGKEDYWIPLACGDVSSEELPDLDESDIQSVLAEVMKETPIENLDSHHQSHIHLGPHWDCLRWVKQRNNFYLAELSLPGNYSHELELYTLHPSLLDIGLSYHARFLSEQSFPFHIERLHIYSNLPKEFYSLVKIEKINEQIGICNANVTLIDFSGKILALAEGFSLRSPNTKDINYEKDLSYGLSNHEGIAVFQAILDYPVPYVMVSKTKNLDAPIRSFKRSNMQPMPNDDPQNEPPDKLKKDNIVEKIRSIWSDVLGISQIDDNDDFFMIGGDSLFAIQVCYKTKTTFGVTIPPEVLLEHSILIDFCNSVNELLQKENATTS